MASVSGVILSVWVGGHIAGFNKSSKQLANRSSIPCRRENRQMIVQEHAEYFVLSEKDGTLHPTAAAALGPLQK
jgi:hypothetical protein